MHERARVEACKAIPLNADVLWYKAQLQQDRLRSRRAAATIAAAQMFALLAGLIALLTVVAPFLLNPDDQFVAIAFTSRCVPRSCRRDTLCGTFCDSHASIGRWMRHAR